MGLALGAILGQFLTHAPEERTRLERYVFLAAALVLLAAGTFVKHKYRFVTTSDAAAEFSIAERLSGQWSTCELAKAS